MRRSSTPAVAGNGAGRAIEATMRDALWLRAFLTVAEHGSYTAAASVLHVHPSTVSRLVSGLEAALGVQLLSRTTRRVSLTAAGIALLPAAERALEALQQLADISQSLGT